MDFTDQVVLVTGASRGIGHEIALQFAAKGAQVIVHYHQNRAAAGGTITSLAGSGHLLIQADMRQAEQLKDMVDTAVDHYGRIDVLVNNAGIYEEHPLAETSYEAWQASWQRVLDTNLIGVANLCWCVGRQMIRQGHGRIVNVSSRGAFRGEPEGPAYGASKAGLNAMSQSLARYLAPYHIYVGVVAPGFVETDMAQESLSGESGRAIRAQSPLNRVASPAEVAFPVLFLAAPGSEWVTGTIIDANGASYFR